MKVLLHNVAGGYGGAERTLELLIPHFQAKMEVWVAGQNPRFCDQIIKLSATFPLTLVRPTVGRSPLNIFAGVIRTVRLCWKERFDSVILNSNKSAMLFALCHRLIPRHTKIIVFVRDFQWTNARFIFWALRSRALFYAPSEAVSELWPAHYGPHKMPGVIPSPFSPKTKKNVLLKVIPDCQESGGGGQLPMGRKFLILGTINAWKGIDTAILAMAQIADEYPDVTLSIVGQSFDKKVHLDLLSLVKMHRLEERVIFTSHQDDITKVIQEHLCLVSASVPWNGGPETFGRTIIESWAMLRPVIASRCGGPKYLITEEVDGLFFEPGDADGLANAFRRILDDPVLMWTMAVNGREKFMRNFTSESVAKSFIKVMES